MQPSCNIGALVLGAPMGPRSLVSHAKLLNAYADGSLADQGEDREAYLSHFLFGPEMRMHHKANRGSVAGFAGPCWARWLVFDIDRPELSVALEDARRLVRFLLQRYPELEPVVFYSGSKGFHVLLELAHVPQQSVGFQHIAKTFAEGLARAAGVVIDDGVYDIARIIRLPNTRHPKTGRYKRRLNLEELFRLEVSRIIELAEHPFGEGLPSAERVPDRLPKDWHEAAQRTSMRAEARATIRQDAGTADTRAPRYLMEFLRFGVDQGERHAMLFKCAAYLAEQGAPSHLVAALLTEPGQDVGLSPKDVERQIRCGIEHAAKQRQQAEAPPDPRTSPDEFERWAIAHEADPLPPNALNFGFGSKSEGGPL